MEAEEKLGRLQEIFSYKINVNNFRDYVEDVIQNGENHTMPPSIRKAKSIVSAIFVSSAESEKDFYKMNVIYSDRISRKCQQLDDYRPAWSTTKRVGSNIICKIMATSKSF